MFITVTRSAAVSALAAGFAVRLDATGEIFQLGRKISKRACRRLMHQWADCAYKWCDRKKPIIYSVLIRQDQYFYQM